MADFLEITYKHIECKKMTEKEIQQASDLFSENYGIWSNSFPKREKRGQNIKYSTSMIKKDFVNKPDRYVIMAYSGETLVGHIFYLKRSGHKTKPIILVLQLVVAKKYRNKRIATRMMRSIWSQSDCYAWGLFTSNPKTIQVLEKATLRKIELHLIEKKLDKIKDVAKDVFSTEKWIDEYNHGIVSTDFYVDHSGLFDRICETYPDGDFPFHNDLPEGKEWLAITFASQKPSFSSYDELENFFDYSREDVTAAYSRMKMKDQPWTKHPKAEIDYLASNHLQSSSRIVDLGCGIGRHTAELHSRGYHVVGVDFSSKQIAEARQSHPDVEFVCSDILNYHPDEKFDTALCLFDVIGSFPDDHDNLKILSAAKKLLTPKGKLIISVMNMDLTMKRCPKENRISKIRDNVELLLELPPSTAMQNTGDVFDGNKMIIDLESGIVYRKEQFIPEDELPLEIIVRDRRYTPDGIRRLLNKAGFVVEKTFCFQAGRMDRPLNSRDSRAKEILAVARKGNLIQRLMAKLQKMPITWTDV